MVGGVTFERSSSSSLLQKQSSLTSILTDSKDEIEPIEHLGYKLLEKNTPIKILIEIVGMTNLAKRETSCNPLSNPSTNENKPKLNTFCTINYKNQILHKTKVIPHDNNPIFDVTTKAYYIFQTTPNEFISSKDKGITFTVYGKDESNSSKSLLLNDQSSILGSVTLKLKDILQNCSEERFEYPLQQMGTYLQKQSGKIALRFRVATEYDSKFMTLLQDKKIKPQRHLTSGKSTSSMAATRISNLNVTGALNNLSKIKAKPNADPQNPTKVFFTKDELKAAQFAPSTNWTETGAPGNSLGKIYLEILGCDNLPNLDVGSAVGNYTDAFVCVVHEDSIVETDVIDDELSPIFLPWTKRAFAFNMMHSLSSIYIGVFDYDVGPLGHDGIGRVVINKNKFLPGVLYTLQYKIHPTATLLEREDFGTITIRLRIEVNNPKKYLLTSREEPPKCFVNMDSNTSFQVARYTCYGAYEDDKFEIKVIQSYVYEFLHYKAMIEYCIGDALNSLIFWHGQVKVLDRYIPLHSMVAFMGGVYLVEHMHLALPFMFFSFGWFMLANLSYRSYDPSPWNRTSFLELLKILLDWPANKENRSIEYRQNAVEAAKFKEAWEKRVADDLELSNKEWEAQLELDAISNEAIQTKTEGKKFDMYASLAPVALRQQKRLSRYCTYCRRLKSILFWDEKLISFWWALWSFAIGLFFLVIPWVFLLHWTLRILVWGGLGPHMMWLEPYYIKYNEANEKKEAEEKVKEARLKGEENSKRKALRELLYGQYNVNVPYRDVAFHYDVPLAESIAQDVRFDESLKKFTTVENKNFIPGQYLNGQMILNRLSEQEDDHVKHTSKFKLRALQVVASLPKDKLIKGRSSSRLRINEMQNSILRTKAKQGLLEKHEYDSIVNFDEGIEVYDTLLNGSSSNLELADTIDFGGEKQVIPRKKILKDDYVHMVDEDEEEYQEEEKEINKEKEQQPEIVVRTITKKELPLQKEISIPKKQEEERRSDNNNTLKPSNHDNISCLSFDASIYSDAREECVEEQGVEIIDDGPIPEEKSKEDESSTSSSLSCLYNSPTSDNVNIAFIRRH